MDVVTHDVGIQEALDALLADRLSVLAGAGLSMAPPSSLPSAAALAVTAKGRYAATYGNTRPPLPDPLEQQAEFFFQRGELATVYFNTLVGHHAFAGPPNEGHYAVADFLLIHALRSTVTTNVDTMIETAGQSLYGEIGVGLDGNELAALPPDVAPLLKLHGCRARDLPNSVWAPGQLAAEPVVTRITRSTTWLRAHLLNRDLLIVGYWTDWDYLNAVLEATLNTVTPSRVIVVDPAPTASFAAKAPALFALGERATNGFHHVQESGADFLTDLRRQFSRTFVRRVLHSGGDDYAAHAGAPANIAWLEPQATDNSLLWQIRRDLEGCLPNKPAQSRMPPAGESLVGLTILQLQAAGAVVEGPYWKLGTKVVRVLRAVNKLLHRVEADYAWETAPAIAPDIVIAVGAESQLLPAHIARSGTPSTIARGSKSTWYNRPDALSALGIA